MKLATALRRLLQFKMNPVDGTAVLEHGLDEETTEIPSVQIFAAGDYGPSHGGVFTEADIDAAIADFGADGRDVPVTLDHAKHGPAYGKVTKAWRVGKKLYAAMSDVPVSLVKAIKAKRYEARSAEFARNFSTEPWRLSRVTFLGAARPKVGGMDPIALSDKTETQNVVWFSADNSAAVDPSEDLGAVESMLFGDMPMPTNDPNPEGHGVLVRQSWTFDNLNHSHCAFLDGNGNGFTGPATAWEEDGKEEVDPHFHLVVAGIIQPAAVNGNVLTHTHQMQASFVDGPKTGRSAEVAAVALSTGENDSHYDTDSQQDSNTMTTPTNPASPASAVQAAGAPISAEQFAEQERKLAELSAKFAAQETAVRVERRSAQIERFDAAADAAVKDGRATPASVKTMRVFYEGLIDGSTSIQFSEAGPKLDAPAAFLAMVREMPKVVVFGQTSATLGGAEVSDQAAPGSARMSDAEITAKTKAFAEHHKIKFSEALIRVEAGEEIPEPAQVK